MWLNYYTACDRIIRYLKNKMDLKCSIPPPPPPPPPNAGPLDIAFDTLETRNNKILEFRLVVWCNGYHFGLWIQQSEFESRHGLICFRSEFIILTTKVLIRRRWNKIESNLLYWRILDKLEKEKALLRIELGLLDSKSNVITITLPSWGYLVANIPQVVILILVNKN